MRHIIAIVGMWFIASGSINFHLDGITFFTAMLLFIGTAAIFYLAEYPSAL